MVPEILGNLALFVISLVVLLRASDWFISAAEWIGLSFGVSPYVIGVTIIAFGTSLPELATSIASVFADDSAIVVGNVIGSNITNILLIIGLVALASKDGIQMRGRLIMEIDMPLLVISAFLLWFTLQDGELSILDAGLYLVGLAIFLYNSMHGSAQKGTDRPPANWKVYVKLLIGGALVYLGAHFTIQGISGLSEMAGIPSEVIALSLVALGTSLPEVAVSIAAARKGKTEMAVGNVMGSNIFNTYAVMGIPRLVGPLELPGHVLETSLPFMVGITIIFIVISLSHKIPRPAGAMLLLFYLFFLVTLFQ